MADDMAADVPAERLSRRNVLGVMGAGLLTASVASVSASRASAASVASVASVAPASTEVLISGSLASYSTFESKWNYLYPWGDSHNGSALMVGSTTDHSHISLSGGVLTLTSTYHVANGFNYLSGTVYAKQQVLVNSSYPTWEVSGDFQASSGKGTWPAFWLTGVNSWPPESDILEFKGDATCWSNTYKNTSGGWTTTKTPIVTPASWHTYKAVLTKAGSSNVQIQYYIDGSLVGTHTGANFVGQPMWLIMDLQMEGSSGSPGPTGTTYFRARNLSLSRSSS